MPETISPGIYSIRSATYYPHGPGFYDSYHPKTCGTVTFPKNPDDPIMVCGFSKMESFYEGNGDDINGEYERPTLHKNWPQRPSVYLTRFADTKLSLHGLSRIS